MSPPLCLVAFEDPALRSSVASSVWAIGFDVRRVSTPGMAVRLLQCGRPIDLVIVEDAVVVARARREGVATPFVVVKSHAHPIDTRGLERVRVVERPLDDAHLREIVTDLLGDRTSSALSPRELEAVR